MVTSGVLMIPVKEKLMFSRESAAEAVDLSLRQIDYRIANGEIEVVKKGRRVLIPREALLRFTRQSGNKT